MRSCWRSLPVLRTIPTVPSSSARYGNEPDRMKRPILPLLRAPLTSLALLATFALQAQRTLHWVGGSGRWNDAAHWSLLPAAAGGAGVPGAKDDVSIAAGNTVHVSINEGGACRDLRISGLVIV